jgi:[acyl-carrier-protein] S-malonyltransferase
MELAKSRGAKITKELAVSGAFHSPLMESAQKGLKSALEGTEIQDASIPVFSNVSAGPVRRSGEIRDSLFRQLTAPVRWEESIVNLIAGGAEVFVEIGPGKVLQGLIKRINAKVAAKGIETLKDISGLKKNAG